MSINHFSSNIPQSQPWWTTHNNNNPQSQKLDQQIPKQPMFQKPLTPSDVGKLNRLVIPKQYAEKYFPLGAVNADSNEKGLLLSFEDESGKFWRFRYSYWSSSQSYVLTKGWSRYVKEKRLDAGDVVLFERHPAEFDRFYIGWRRRVSVQPTTTTAAQGSGGAGWGQVFYNAHPYPTHSHGPPITYQDECLHAGLMVANENSAANVKGSSKRHVRLFGVDLECEPEESESEPVASDGSSFSSDGPAHYQFYSSTNHQNHMDMNVAGSGDMKEMRYVQYKG
jgi:hypothetical protein